VLEPSLIIPFMTRLAGLGVPYMVTGSTAGILYGEPRMTHDVDIVVALAPRDVQAFVAAFPDDEFYCPPEDVLAIEVRREARGHCNLIHHATGFKADIYVAADELHEWGLAHRNVIVVDGVEVAVAPVEYVIVRKLEYYREGRSPKHVRDILGMLEVSEASIDRAALDGWLDRLGLRAVWDEVTRSTR
jgi:hypothetical protein